MLFSLCFFLMFASLTSFDSWNRYAPNRTWEKRHLYIQQSTKTEFLFVFSFLNINSAIFVKVTGTKCLLLTQPLQLKILQAIISFHVKFTYRGSQPYEAYIMTCISTLLNKGRTCICYFLTPSLCLKISWWCHLQDKRSHSKQSRSFKLISMLLC